MKRDKIALLLIHFLVMALVFLVYNLVEFELDYNRMKFLEYVLMVIYCYSIITGKYYLSWLHSYMIFLYTTFLFNFSRILLDIVGYREFGWATKFANYYFFYDVRIEILKVFIIVLLCLHLGYIIAIIGNDKVEEKNIGLKENIFYGKIGKILFFISFPPLIYKMFIQMKIIMNLGYSSYYTGVLKNIEYPFFTRGSGTLMTIGFLIFLISVPKKNEFLKVSTLYLIIKLVDSFKGARAIFLTQLLFIIWYYSKIYNVKIKIGYMLKLLGFTVIFSQILLSIRSKKIFTMDLVNGIYNFLFSQGVSYLVLGYIIDFKEKLVGLGNYPYIFQGIVGFKGQSLETLNSTNSLADKLTYILDSRAYLQGEGIGSNYIAELYDLGYFWLILISILLGILIIKYEKYSLKNRFILMTTYYFIPNLFYMPRGSFFGDGLIKNMLFLVSVYLIVKIIDFIKEKIEEKIKNDREENILRLDRR